MTRTPTQKHYDALVYWRDRFDEEHTCLMMETSLPSEIRSALIVDTDAILDRLKNEIERYEETGGVEP